MTSDTLYRVAAIRDEVIGGQTSETFPQQSIFFILQEYLRLPLLGVQLSICSRCSVITGELGTCLRPLGMTDEVSTGLSTRKGNAG